MSKEDYLKLPGGLTVFPKGGYMVTTLRRFLSESELKYVKTYLMGKNNTIVLSIRGTNVFAWKSSSELCYQYCGNQHVCTVYSNREMMCIAPVWMINRLSTGILYGDLMPPKVLNFSSVYVGFLTLSQRDLPLSIETDVVKFGPFELFTGDNMGEDYDTPEMCNFDELSQDKLINFVFGKTFDDEDWDLRRRKSL
jgi:hypothetical protein